MWFWLAIIALLCWSGSDLFSKIGCRDQNDKLGYLKMVTAVGTIMGLHALVEILSGTQISFDILITYLPVSLLYISSMTLGYLGLRYIELSVSSPICNSSGALVAVATIIMCALTGEKNDMVALQYLAVALACGGVIGLGIVEASEDDEVRAARQEKSNYKYSKSWLALLLPIAYCILDAAGTFADSLVLKSLNEDSANVAYELTFLIAGIICLIISIAKKSRFTIRAEAPKYIGAAFETAGQLAYIYAISDEQHITMSAPIISSYCAVSVIWSRIFLKERLSWKHYICIATVVAGIIIMGVFDM